MGEGRTAVYNGDLFDCQGYLARHSDLQAAFGTDCEAAFNHYGKGNLRNILRAYFYLRILLTVCSQQRDRRKQDRRRPRVQV